MPILNDIDTFNSFVTSGVNGFIADFDRPDAAATTLRQALALDDATLAQIARLHEALRQVLTGEGELVHPTAGTIRVFVAGKYSIKEAPAAEGGNKNLITNRLRLVSIKMSSARFMKAMSYPLTVNPQKTVGLV